MDKKIRMKISFPTDENGLTGRQCPSCEEYFKVKFGTGLQSENPCYCPYCRHQDDHLKFMTKEQNAYMESLILKETIGPALAELDKSFRDLERATKNGFIQIKVTTSGNPLPVKYYQERDLETHVICDSCGLVFAIYGVFATCPDCCRLNAAVVFEKSIEVAKKKLGLVDSVESEALKEGLLEDALSAGISAFDAFGKALREHHTGILPDKPRNLFQNLKALCQVMTDTFGIQLHDLIVQEKAKVMNKMFQVRHIYEHNAGVVDADFIKNVPPGGYIEGRKYALQKNEILIFLDALAETGKKIEEKISGSL
jgi:hypothetical protein